MLLFSLPNQNSNLNQATITGLFTSLKQWLWIVAFSLSLLSINGCQQAAEYSQINGYTMGTSYHITIRTDNDNASRLKVLIDKRLSQINHLMSTYQTDSELSLFNQSDSIECQPLHAETIKVLNAANDISKASSGAFDVTVAPLIEMWGFDKTDTNDAIPNQDAINQALAEVGYDQLHIGKSENGQPCLRKAHPKVTANLSAIAKGYAVDAVAALISQQGITDYMVEIGGEIATRGHNARGIDWQIAVEKPSAGSRQVQEVIQVSGVGIATSGDYRNYFEKNGQRYSHTIDPTTGKPINHSLASVTVIMDDTMHADGWATAFMVMGEQKAFDYANAHEMAAYFIYKSKNGFCEAYSAKFAQYFSHKPKNSSKLVYNCAP